MMLSTWPVIQKLMQAGYEVKAAYSFSFLLKKEDSTVYFKFYSSGEMLSVTHADYLGRFHRLDGPAYQEFDDDGLTVRYEEYRQEDLFHRNDGPAIIRLHTGKETYLAFYERGHLMRTWSFENEELK